MTNEPLVYDIETDGNPWDGRLLCIGWKYLGETRVESGPGVSTELRLLLGDPSVPKVTWSKYDARWLTMHGVTVVGPHWDAMVMAYRLNENTPLTLEYCAKRYTHTVMDKRIRTSAGNPVFRTDEGREVPLGEAPMEQVRRYNGEDVEATDALYLNLRKRLEDSMWWDHYLAEDVPFTQTLLDMETAGLPVNLDESETLRVQLEAEAVRMQRALLDEAGLPDSFNLNSGPQLSGYLFAKVFELTDSLRWTVDEVDCLKSCLADEHEDCDYDFHIAGLLPDGFTIDKVGSLQVHGRWTLKGRGLPPGILTPSGDRPSTSSPALLTNLRAATDPWVADLLRYRKVTKVLTTYLRKFPVLAHEGRIYGRFNQTGTVTGRLSSSEPNLQNIPAHGDLGPKVRHLFQGDLVVGDYSQLEPRLMAHFSQDPFLLDVYRTGKDIYTHVAAAIFGVEPEAVTHDQRGIGKTLVLAMGYGAGPVKVAQILTINGYPTDERTAKAYLRELQLLVAQLFAWRDSAIARAKRDGYVATLGGTHRRLAAQFKQTTWKARGYGERQAVNAIIQGSAGAIVQRTMVRQGVYFRDELRLLAQVHDELVNQKLPGFSPVTLGEYARFAAEGHGYQLSVPLVFEPNEGGSWLDAKEGTTFILPEDMASDFEDGDAEMEEA